MNIEPNKVYIINDLYNPVPECLLGSVHVTDIPHLDEQVHKALLDIHFDGKFKIIQNQELVDKDNGGQEYESPILEDPFLIDILEEGSKQAATNKNNHFTFFEGLKVIKEENGIKYIELCLGS